MDIAEAIAQRQEALAELYQKGNPDFRLFLSNIALNIVEVPDSQAAINPVDEQIALACITELRQISPDYDWASMAILRAMRDQGHLKINNRKFFLNLD